MLHQIKVYYAEGKMWRRRAALCIAFLGAIIAALVAIPGASSPARAASCPWMRTNQSPAKRAHELLAAMSLNDKLQMVTGKYGGSSNPNPASASYILANPALCIPALVMNDSINGIGDAQLNTTAFPDSIALTSSWDPSLARRYGRVLAREALAKGVNVLLGPGVDIARNPLNGRNFEYAGEDPYLAGQAAAAMIRGVQSQHVIATVKHYALNDQENNRNTDSSDASARTMQEIDLPAFETAVKAGVGSVMCSYNRINSVYACQNRYTQRRVLDHQFRFSGFVMSDWGATHSTVPSARNGLDMEMPSRVYYGGALANAIAKHQVSMATLNEMAYRIIFTMFRIGAFDHVPAEGTQAASNNASTPASIAMATKVAENGTVLLKNVGHALPLTGPAKRIAVIGPSANHPAAMFAEQGYGSGHVPEFGYQSGVVSPLQSIATRAAKAGDVVTYADGDVTADAIAAAKASDVAVVFIYDVEIEGADRPDLTAHPGTCSFLDFSSPTECTYSALNQDALVSAVAKANPHTIVVIQNGDPVAMPWAGQVQGIVENWYPGQVDGDAIAPILFGDVDPAGKLPLTFPKRLADDPLKTAAQYPGVTRSGDSVGPHSTYSEGLLVGYRWYDAKHIAPLFPFGFGLSYTTFRFSQLRIHATRSRVRATFTIQNTGRRFGAEVAQVYVGMPSFTGEPPRQLKGFMKVWLKPAQSRRVSIPLAEAAFAHWANSSKRWIVTKGTYRVYVGDSSRNLMLSAGLHRARAKLPAGAY